MWSVPFCRTRLHARSSQGDKRGAGKRQHGENGGRFRDSGRRLPVLALLCGLRGLRVRDGCGCSGKRRALPTPPSPEESAEEDQAGGASGRSQRGASRLVGCALRLIGSTRSVLRCSDDEGSDLSEDRDLEDEFMGGYDLARSDALCVVPLRFWDIPGRR